MANVKITDLAAYTDPASTDVLPIVDVGADVTKKVSIADLLENAGSGTESLPGIAFDGDPNTGIYSPGADQIAFSTNGAERVEFGTSEVVFNDGGADYDFRIEGDTEANLFFVDASAEAVGIGTASPGGALEIDAAAATSPFIAKINTSERARIDSSGRLLVGLSSEPPELEGITPRIVSSSSSGVSGAQDVAIYNFQNAGGSGRTRVGPKLFLGNSRSDTNGSVGGIVNNVDHLGNIRFAGDDGAKFVTAAEITAEVDGIPGVDDMPGRLVFSVTADGSATPTEAMRIKNTRVINFSNAPVYADNAAAKTGGLVDGDVYRTSTGDLKIVYT